MSTSRYTEFSVKFTDPIDEEIFFSLCMGGYRPKEAFEVVSELPDWQPLTIEQYAEIFPSPDPSRENDPQLTIIDDANEKFALQLYRAHVDNMAQFAEEEVQHIIRTTSATEDDLRWSQGLRGVMKLQSHAAWRGQLRWSLDLAYTYNC